MAVRALGPCAAACALVLALGGTAWAYDYETCFAFDPVFVQADQRRAAQGTPRQEGTSEARGEAGTPRKPPALRLSLKTLQKALQATSAKPEKARDKTAKGGDAR